MLDFHPYIILVTPYVGILGGILGVALFIPQIKLSLKAKNMSFVAPETYHIVIANDLVWAIYGILIDNPILYLPNIIGVILSAFLLTLKSRYG